MAVNDTAHASVTDPTLLEAEAVATAFHVKRDAGLSGDRAAALLAEHGPNELRSAGRTPLIKRILAQLKDPLVILLLIAAVISVGAWALEGAHGAPIEALVVVLVVVFNVVIGLVQESKAADAVAALASMTEARATVLRDGRRQTIPGHDVVPGDVLCLAEGDQVAADARLFHASALRVAEAALTGESAPVEKSTAVLAEPADLGDRTNMVFRGTGVSSGTGLAIVTATGMDTEMGHVAGLLDQTEQTESPLTGEINHVSGLLGRIVVIIAIVIMLTIAIVQTPHSATDWVTILLLGVSLAVAAVPEGLPAILSVVLALGVQRMAKRNAVVKNLNSAETLGSASVICTDKTGTLTQNAMTIARVVTASGTTEFTGVGYDPAGGAIATPAEPAGSAGVSGSAGSAGAPGASGSEGTVGEAGAARALREAALAVGAGALANDSQLVHTAAGWDITGDPTDAAFLVAAHKVPQLRAAARESASGLPATRLDDIPFSSERKMMTTLHHVDEAVGQVVATKGQGGAAAGGPGAVAGAATGPGSGDNPLLHWLSGRRVILSKGAPDVLLDRCTAEQVGDDAVVLDKARRRELLAGIEALSAQGYRAIGVAAKPAAVAPASNPAGTSAARKSAGGDLGHGAGTVSELTEADESDLCYLGTVAIIDPPRPEVRDAIGQAHRAGIRVVMITGDHPATARAIGSQLGIVAPDAPALTGRELDALDDAGWAQAVEDVSVYARVAPEHKLKIVSALQAQGQIVAMTGDGVNDAPALKAADIGVAMGITGTEVSKEAARMVLADDNFATIVRAVHEGRTIFDNIKKFLRYLLCANMGEVLGMFFGVVLMGVIGLTAAAQETGAALAVPLLATQILWLNLVTDTLPALAVGVDPELDDVMGRPPRKRSERVIDRNMWVAIFTTGFTMALGLLLVMDLCLPGGLIPAIGPFGVDGLDEARTTAFTTLVLANLFSVFNARSGVGSAFHGLFHNRLLWGAIAISVLLQIAVVYVPFLQVAFGTAGMSVADWVVATLGASLVLWAEELRKIWVRARSAVK